MNLIYNMSFYLFFIFYFYYIKNPRIIKNITPGTPNTPAINAVIILNGIEIPIAPPNVLTKNTSNAPIAQLIASFIIFFTGHARSFAITITAIAAKINTV